MMKKLLLLLLALFSVNSFAAVIQQKVLTYDDFGTGQAVFNITFDSPTTAGNCLAAQFFGYEQDENGNIGVTGVTDNNSSGFSNLAAAAGSEGGLGIRIGRTYTAPNIAGRSGHIVTVTFNENVGGAEIVITEISECHLTTPQGGGMYATGTSPPTGTGVTPDADGIHLALIGTLGTPISTFTPASGWTENQDFSVGVFSSNTSISRTAANGVSQTAAATPSNAIDTFSITHAWIRYAGGGGGPSTSIPVIMHHRRQMAQ